MKNNLTHSSILVLLGLLLSLHCISSEESEPKTLAVGDPAPTFTAIDQDAVVVGVSGDAPAGLKVFQQTHQLNFDLLADYNGMIAKAFGVPMKDEGVIERTFLGKPVSLERGVTASRWTFIIGKDGKVMHKNTQVNAAQNSAHVMNLLGL